MPPVSTSHYQDDTILENNSSQINLEEPHAHTQTSNACLHLSKPFEIPACERLSVFISNS